MARCGRSVKGVLYETTKEKVWIWFKRRGNLFLLFKRYFKVKLASYLILKLHTIIIIIIIIIISIYPIRPFLPPNPIVIYVESLFFLLSFSPPFQKGSYIYNRGQKIWIS